MSVEAPVSYVQTSDGFSIAYTVEGSGPPLVWIPMIFDGGVGRPWGRYTRSYAERFQVIRYDPRGQGLSQRGLHPSHSELDYLLDLAAVVERLKPRPFVLLAPHQKARVAIAYAHAHPDMVRTLLLRDPNISPTQPPRERNYPALLQLAAQDWDYYLDSLSRTGGSLHDPAAARRIAEDSMTQDDFLTMFRAPRWDCEALLKDITTPTLIVTSRSGTNPFVTPESSKKLAASMPNARLVVFDDWPGDVPTKLMQFIESLPAEEPGRTAANSANRANGLTARELEVLRLIAAGRSNPQIAGGLSISLSTVQHHVSHIFGKIGAANRTEAAAYAHVHGLV